MHATCLHCTRPLGANEVLETLPIGRRIAFDAAQGRLWVVCRHCAKWNLVPFDTRLETIDAAERLFRDTRTRYSTDNIGLARVPEGLELVRIGPALRPEFAAWRFGAQYRKRRRNTAVAVGLGMAGAAGGALLLGLTSGSLIAAVGSTVSWGYIGGRVTRNRRGRLIVQHAASEQPITVDRGFSDLSVLTWEADTPVFQLPAEVEKNHLHILEWSGLEHAVVGRRVVGVLNDLRGARRELEDATAILAEHRGDLGLWTRLRADELHASGTRQLSKRDAEERHRWLVKTDLEHLPTWPDPGRPFLLPSELSHTERLAVEIWLNEDLERIWLEGELKLLEREWREAERIAAIADGLALEYAQE